MAKITFVGNFDVPYCTEVHHKKTFEKLGHTAIPFREGKAQISDIRESAIQSDMFYYTHTHGWGIGTDQETRQLFADLRTVGIPSVGYHLDLWMGLKREQDLRKDPYWELEHFFTVDKLMADWLNANTNTKGYYLPPGVFEDECYMAEPNREKYPHDIVFTGSGNYHPEYGYRPMLIDWLKRTYGERFAHYGGGGLPGLRGHELNVLYASAKVVIGDTLCKNFTYPYYFSDRFTEVPGRGGFMIFPHIKGVELMYDSGREMIFYPYGDFEWLKNCIDHYLTHDEERETIRLAGHKRAKESHTYSVRLQQILDTLNIK